MRPSSLLLINVVLLNALLVGCAESPPTEDPTSEPVPTNSPRTEATRLPTKAPPTAIPATQTPAASPTPLVFSPAYQAQTWVRLGGPPGGLGYDIRVRPDDPDTWYVTDAFSGIHMSTDGGITWSPINTGINTFAGPSGDSIPVFSVTIDPNDHDILWLGLQGVRGIYRSADRGLTWEKRTSGITENFGLTIRGLAVQPGNSEVVYAAGELSSFLWAGRNMWGVQSDRVKGVIYKSTDAGLYWKKIWQGDSLARYVLIDPTDVNILYVSTGIFDREAANSDPAARTPGGVGVLKSTDGGQTWTQINSGLQNLYIGSLAMNPEDSRVLLAAAGNTTYRAGAGIYLSRDGGARWTKVIDGQLMMAVDFFPGSPQLYYATGGIEPFYVSSDAGRTWDSFTTLGGNFWRPEGYRPGLPIDIEVDPRDPARIFVNNYGGGNYLSTDGGKTWVSASIGYSGAEIWDVTVHPSNPAVVYANGRSGPFVSADAGFSWQGINPQVHFIQDGPQISIDPNNPAHLLASEAQGGTTFESKDGGATWSFVLNLASEQVGLGTRQQAGLYPIVFAPSNPEIVYGGMSTWDCAENPAAQTCTIPPLHSLMTSTNGGANWSVVEANPIQSLSVLSLVVHPADPSVLWIGTGGGGVFRTTLEGSAWEEASDGLGSRFVAALAMDPTDPDVLYAGTADRGVYKSADGGTTWSRSSSGMDPNEPISAVVVDPQRPEIVYAGSKGSGVFVSTDGGATWQRIVDGLRVRAVRALALSFDGGTLYAATLGEGVYRLSVLNQDELNAYGAIDIPIP